MSAYLQFHSLGKCYDEVVALNDVSLDLQGGDVLALLGPNGAGKSTLFGCLLGFTRPTHGQILQNGAGLTQGFHRRIGYMPERIALYPQSSVRENGLFFARLKRQPASELERQLKRVGLYDVQERAAGKLSKGMLQRLGLAIALCGEPELLILDEPFNGLDPALLETLQSILADERERGATLIISTHTMSAVEPLATHVAVLLEGKLAAHGSIAEMRATFGDVPLETIYHAIARSRSAGFQPAVSPICNRQGVGNEAPHGRDDASQVENLRYGRLEVCATGEGVQPRA
ncbi:MAG TPA: ABC transporter ATP-binding protein [Candidatus Acidoferrum sp.]|nr:ABC transporter ATP-binding protein [Candidatus Acidoferrum sp.]